MSSSLREEPPDVHIDRLALDIPGLDVAQARSLAFAIAEGLAGVGLSGEHARIEITLGPSGAGQPDLAVQIVAALMERLV
jgi:hypothetical protein